MAALDYEALRLLTIELAKEKKIDAYLRDNGSEKIQNLVAQLHKSHNVQIEQIICAILMNLSVNKTAREYMKKHSALDQLSHYVTQYKDKDRQVLARNAVGAIANLLIEESNQKYLESVSGIEPIVEMLRICEPTDFLMRRFCIQCFTHLASNDKVAAELVQKYEALYTITTTIDACYHADDTHSDIIFNSLHLLWKLASVVNSDLCDDNDLVEMLILLLHHKEVNIVTTVLLLLRMFSTEEDGAQQIQVQKNGLDTIIKVVQVYTKRKNYDIVHQGLSLILNLCTNDADAREYFSIVSVHMFRDLLLHDNEKIRKECLHIISRIALDEKLVPKVGDAIPVVIALLKQKKSISDALFCLNVLIECEKHLPVVHERGTKTIIDLLKQYSKKVKDIDNLELIVQYLHSITSIVENAQKIERDIIPILLDLLEVNNEKIQYYSALTLRNLKFTKDKRITDFETYCQILSHIKKGDQQFSTKSTLNIQLVYILIGIVVLASAILYKLL